MAIATDLINSITSTTSPTRTPRIDPINKRIIGFVDGIEAIEQYIYAALDTERYAYLIYDWNFGAALEKFIEEDFSYIFSALPYEITSCLLANPQILSVGSFVLTKTDVDSCTVEFTVKTSEGTLKISKEVDI